jgi:hypothetical protein
MGAAVVVCVVLAGVTLFHLTILSFHKTLASHQVEDEPMQLPRSRRLPLLPFIVLALAISAASPLETVIGGWCAQSPSGRLRLGHAGPHMSFNIARKVGEPGFDDGAGDDHVRKLKLNGLVSVHDSQLAAPPSALAAHTRVVALHAGHARSPHPEARAVLHARSVLATMPSLTMEHRTSLKSAAARMNRAERRKISDESYQVTHSGPLS